VVNTPDDESEFERRTKALFDQSVTQLEASKRSKLAQARTAALKELEPHPSNRLWRIWAPAGGLAAAAIAAVAIVFKADAPMPTARTDSALEDLDLLAREDDAIEMMQDLEFYAWLDEQADWTGEHA
jgi:hypothetical protein